MKRFFFLCTLTLACTCVRAQVPSTSAYVLPTEDEFKTGFAISESDLNLVQKDTAYTRVFLIENELNLAFLIRQLNELLMNQPLVSDKTIMVSVTERKIE